MGGDFDETRSDCPIDASITIATPFDGAFDQPLTNTICPRRDDDHWRIQTSGANRIVLAEATYNKLQNFRLGLEWFGARGACVNDTPASCAIAADCGTLNGMACDLQRGRCRASGTEILCAAGAGCSGATSCDTTRLMLASSYEADNNSSNHRVEGIFSAVEAGEYIVRVFDQAEVLEDEDILYTLTLTEYANPDGNEPNDGRNLSSVLTSGTAVDGYLATLGDVDWYRIDYAGSTPPVVTIDMTWPAGMSAAPTWALATDGTCAGLCSGGDSPGARCLASGDCPNGTCVAQGTLGSMCYDDHDCTGSDVCRGAGDIPSARDVLEGNGVHRRNAALVRPLRPQFWVKVTNSGATDRALPYTLRVSVAPDATEPTPRNDTFDTAHVVSLGAPDAAPPGAVTDSIIAQNDRDWYELDTTSIGENSLLWVSINGPLPIASAPYLLQAHFYRTCDPNTQCPGATQCFDASSCLDPIPFYQLPNPDAQETSSDPSLGGRTPNQLTTQMPILENGGEKLYVQISHNTSTTRAMSGYGSATYTLQAAHKREPDAVERLETSRDSNWISRPLLNASGKGAFFIRARDVAYQAGGYSAGVSGGAPHVVLSPGQSVTPPTAPCQMLDLDAYDDQGNAAVGPTDVLVTSNSGLFVANCADTTLTSNAILVSLAGPGGQVGFIPAGIVETVTITTQVGGGALIPFALPVYSTTAPVFLTLAGPRTTPIGGFSDNLTVSVPVNRASDLIVTIARPAGSANVACYAGLLQGSSAVCPNIARAGADACASTGSVPPCDLPIITGQNDYELNVESSGTGLIVLQASAPGYVAATWVLAPWQGGSYQRLAMSGFISYAGDSDFFSIALPAGMRKSGLEVSLSFSGNVEMRMSVTRDDTPAGYCSSGGCGVSVTAPCGAGPCVAPASGVCGYVYRETAGNLLNVWVNDDGHDSWDENATYTFDVLFTEGCPSDCTSYDCSF